MPDKLPMLSRERVPWESGALLGVSALLCLACQRAPKSEHEQGAGVFTRACASCHAVSEHAKATLGFKVPPPDLRDPKLLGRLDDTQLRTVIRDGKGQMPPFGRMLSETEVSVLLAYLRSPARSTPAGP